MTEQTQPQVQAQTAYKKGVVRTLKGLVIKVQFDEGIPDLNEMLYVDNEKSRRCS